MSDDSTWTEDERAAYEGDLEKMRAHIGKVIREKRVLQERIKVLEAAPKVEPQVEMPSEGDSPRAKFMRDNCHRLHAIKDKGSPEYAAELAKLMEEMDPLIKQEIHDTVTVPMIARTEKLKNTYVSVRRDQEAHNIVAAIARPEAATLMHRLVVDRIQIAKSDDDFEKWPVTAMDRNGKPIELTALAEEMRTDPSLAGAIRGATQAEREAHHRKVAETLGLKPQVH